MMGKLIMGPRHWFMRDVGLEPSQEVLERNTHYAIMRLAKYHGLEVTTAAIQRGVTQATALGFFDPDDEPKGEAT